MAAVRNLIVHVLLSVAALTTVASPQTSGRADSLASLRLSNAEMKQVVSQLEPLAFDLPDSWSNELRGKRVDLGANPGLVLEGTSLLCGGTGNCQIFVFRNVNGKWLSLFSDQAPIGESFTFGPGTTKGIKDLTIVTNSSAVAQQSVAYKFDGNLYQKK